MSREWSIHSWRITASSGPIAGEQEKTALPKVAPPPEQTFLANALLIEHEPSGWVLSFNAEDALKQSVADENEPVKVALASKWQADRVDVLQDVKKMNYDWTYTTSYAGQWSHKTHPAPAMTMRNSDKQLNVELLTDRTIPLVAYHEAPLFVSELDDAGASELTVRVRVTDRTFVCRCLFCRRLFLTLRLWDALFHVPVKQVDLRHPGSLALTRGLVAGYWFVLLRFYLRVDDTVVRLRDVRWYWDDESTSVIRETRWHETRDPSVVRAGGSTSDQTASLMMSMAPTGVVRYAIEETDRLLAT